MEGNFGCGVMKVLVVVLEYQVVEVLVWIFYDQVSLVVVFKVGELECDLVVVVCFQGLWVNGMLELYKFMLFFGVLQDCGFKVVLVIDGCMFGVLGKVFVVIYVSLEVIVGGLLVCLCDGDWVWVDGVNGELWVLVDDVEWQVCSLELVLQDGNFGCGCELFVFMCNVMSSVEEGVCSFIESFNGWC